MKQLINVGVVCLARTTYDYKAAKEIYDNVKLDLLKDNTVNYSIIDELVIEVDEAKNAALELSTKNLDALVVISGTFHLGHLVLELEKQLKLPTLLWAFKELPYNGGKIRLNSVCGANLNASNLYKSDKRDYCATVSNNIDQEFLDAIRIKKSLKDAHIGIIGYRAHGFFNLNIDELSTYRNFGVLVDHYELSDVYNTEINEDSISHYLTRVNEFNTKELNDYQITQVATLCAKLKVFCDKNNIKALAIRCWPEFAKDFGISPCAAMSILQSEGYVLGCEGDIDGIISMLVHKSLGVETPFLADLSQVDFDENFALMWHCGVAPCNLWDGKCVKSLDTYFAAGRGVTAGFVMKPGILNILRFDSVHGKYRIFMQKGEGLPMDKLLCGTYVKCKFENNINHVLDTVIENGIAHHVSLAYGNQEKAIKKFAKLFGYEVIE